jgi:hypothetical protein
MRQQQAKPLDHGVLGPAEFRRHIGEGPLGQRQVAVQALDQHDVFRAAA